MPSMRPVEETSEGLLMVIDKYIPAGMYGFVRNENLRLYFHLEQFDPGSYAGDSPVPPIIGESVEVLAIGGESNKARRVSRLQEPVGLVGVVDWFDEPKGYGFILSDCGKSFYLHRSEVQDGRLPIAGRRVSFYAERQNRACHITVESQT